MLESAVRVRRARADHIFFPLIAFAAAIYVVLGFGPTYYFKALTDAPDLRPFVHLHGLIFSTWLALFLVQTLLVRSGSVSVHRRVGVIAAGLAVLMIVVGVIAAIGLGPRHPAPNVMFATAFGELATFAVFIGSAISYRKTGAIHKRLMLLATVSILDSATGRWPLMAAMFWNADPGSTVGTVASSALSDLIVVAGLVYDKRVHGRIHAAFIWGGLILVAAQAVRAFVPYTELWQAFTAALLRLAA
jgi:hypothetical protein